MLIATIVMIYVISITFGALISYKNKNSGLFMPFTLGALAPLLAVTATTYLVFQYLI